MHQSSSPDMYLLSASASSSTVRSGSVSSAAPSSMSFRTAVFTRALMAISMSGERVDTRMTLTSVSKKSLRVRCMRKSDLSTMPSAAHCSRPDPTCSETTPGSINKSAKGVLEITRRLRAARRGRSRSSRPWEMLTWRAVREGSSTSASRVQRLWMSERFGRVCRIRLHSRACPGRRRFTTSVPFTPSTLATPLTPSPPITSQSVSRRSPRTLAARSPTPVSRLSSQQRTSSSTTSGSVLRMEASEGAPAAL